MAKSGVLRFFTVDPQSAVCVAIVRSFLKLVELVNIAVGEIDLSRGGLTRCYGVFDHGFHLRRNIALKESSPGNRNFSC